MRRRRAGGGVGAAIFRRIAPMCERSLAACALAACALAACALAACALIAPPAGAATAPHLSVRAATLIEASTGQRLLGVNPDGSLPIASTTKLMTALLTLEHPPLSRILAAPNYYPSAAESQIGLVPGERMSIHDLLLALLLPSANDAAEDLAYNLGHGSVGRFVGMMDVRARELHLTHTHYETPVGLDTPGNYSSASDLVTLANYLRRHFPFFARVVAMRSAVLHTGNHTRSIVNRNDLLGKYPWMNGIKSGHTLDAGYVLVGSGTRNGMTLLSAVLGTSSEASRDENTLALLEYGFADFRLAAPLRAKQVLAHEPVRNRPGRPALVIAQRGFTRVVQRGTILRTRVELPRDVAGPLRWHAVVGQVVVLSGRHPLARIPLLLAHSLPAPSTANAARVITATSALASVLVLFGAATVVVAIRRRLRTRRPTDEGAPA